MFITKLSDVAGFGKETKSGFKWRVMWRDPQGKQGGHTEAAAGPQLETPRPNGCGQMWSLMHKHSAKPECSKQGQKITTPLNGNTHAMSALDLGRARE